MKTNGDGACQIFEKGTYTEKLSSGGHQGGQKSAVPRDFQLKSAVPVISCQSSASRHFVINDGTK